MLKQSAATATLVACVIAVLILVSPWFGHTPFDTLTTHLAPESLLERWIR